MAGCVNKRKKKKKKREGSAKESNNRKGYDNRNCQLDRG